MLITKDVLSEFGRLIEENTCNPYSGPLKTGVDLGTANIVIAVTDEENRPVAGATAVSKVVKDGIVVDFVGAMQTVRRLKLRLEHMLGVTLETAATAIPPGIIEGNVRCISNVVEGAGFEVTNVIDEPTAAASVLDIADGAVVDVGGGTTGISILRGGKVIFTADEPTGGTHMTLVLAGYYGISIEEAEELKKDKSREDDVFPVIKPVVQKMASIVKGFLTDHEVDRVYVVGGASCFKDFESTFEKELGITTVKTNDSLLVTPLGIAWNAQPQSL
ncbi:MAG: ethanolamine utilization protein EutJ [Clostridium sp.]|nr:ethanolamine utilization protein EutJ [Clostridium sp.]